MPGAVIRPFAAVGAAWGLLGGLLCVTFSVEPLRALQLSLLLWAVALLDLAVLAKTFASIGQLGSSLGADKRRRPAFWAVFWAGAKLGCLGLFVLIFSSDTGSPALALVTGLGTLVIVPLVGGILWNQREAATEQAIGAGTV